MYIVTNMTSKQEKDELQRAFNDMDVDGDGKLSKEELITGYTKLYNDPVRATEEVNKLMKQVDVDGNGYIDYSGSFVVLNRVEFLLATANRQNAISQDNLKRAFDMFDKVK